MANKSKTKNTVAGVIILVVIVLIAIFSVVVLGQWAWELFEKLSKLDAVVIVALITGASFIFVYHSKILFPAL